MTKEKQQNLKRFDRGEVKNDVFITEEGYIRGEAIVTRTGVFIYHNPDGSIRRELRHPDEVWNEESISSMESIPITNNHPEEKLVSSKNFKDLVIGYTGQDIKKDGDYIIASLVIADQDGVDWIKNQKRRELSLGYTVDLYKEDGIYKDEPYDYIQKNIRYNHLAIVDKGRAGEMAKIALDRSDTIEILKEEKVMAKKKIKIDQEEIMVEPATAEYIERLLEDLKNLEEEKLRVEREIDEIKEKLERTEAERDSLREKTLEVIEEKKEVISMDEASFNHRVSERVSLLRMASEMLSKESKVNIDSMTNDEIKRKIISEKRKSISLDGKSAVYIDAMFDTIMDDHKNLSVNISNVKFAKIDSLDSSHLDLSPTEKARLDMMNRQKNLHKKESK